MAKKITIQPGQRVGLKLTSEEREAVLEIIGLDTNLDARIRRTSPAQQSLMLALDELHLLAYYIADEVNRIKDRRLQKKLNRISERIQGLLEMFEEK